LVGTGSLGVGFQEKDLACLTKLQNVKIIFACGKNAELYHHIKNLNYKNVIPLEFYQPMDELYAVADVFVGKPGGLSVAESLRWNLPLIVCYTLPGQEEKNLTYLANRKLVIARPKNLAGAVNSELQTGAFRQSLTDNANAAKVFGEGDEPVRAVKLMLHGL